MAFTRFQATYAARLPKKRVTATSLRPSDNETIAVFLAQNLRHIRSPDSYAAWWESNF